MRFQAVDICTGKSSLARADNGRNLDSEFDDSEGLAKCGLQSSTAAEASNGLMAFHFMLDSVKASQSRDRLQRC